MSHYSTRLAQALEQNDMKQRDLVDKTKLSKSGVSQYLSGRVLPSKNAQKRIAEVLELPVEWFHSTESPLNPHEEKIVNLKVEQAATLLGKSANHVRHALQQGVVSWGYAICTGPDRYDYHVSKKGLADYLKENDPFEGSSPMKQLEKIVEQVELKEDVTFSSDEVAEILTECWMNQLDFQTLLVLKAKEKKTVKDSDSVEAS